MSKLAAIFILLFTLFVGKSLVGATFSISGSCRGINGKEIRYLIPADPFSGKELCLATAVVDAKGQFNLQGEIKQYTFGWLASGFSRAEIYVYPGMNLQLDITVEETKSGRNPYLEPPFMKLDLRQEKPGTLNQDITLFNSTFDQFITTKGLALKSKKNNHLSDSLNALIYANKPDTSIQYFRDYIFYRMAVIPVFLGEMPYKKAFIKYINPKEINLNNISFCDFFNSFFENYFFTNSKNISLNDLDICINKKVDLRALLDSIGKDSLLRNERIRELVLLKQFPSLYYSNNYSKPNLVHLLESFVSLSKFKDHQEIAMNLKFEFTHLEKGAALADFNFKKPGGSPLVRDSLMGKITYLIFFINPCDLCEQEQDLIPALAEKYKGKIRFLSICCDEAGFSLDAYLRDHPKYRWDFAWFNGNYRFLEAMQVKSYPFFVLLGEEGKILQYPARKPSERLDTYLKTLVP